ncbi:hypothetical protein OKW11_005237 [Pseudomonas baetica]|nr:hypothetical protein [Pseudomonas baetica]
MADSDSFVFAGGDYKITKDLTAQYYYGSLEDFYKQHYLGLIHNTWSALFTYSLSGHAFSAGYQQVCGDSAFPFVNQGDGATAYLITDRQIGKFLSAGERTWLAGYGYDFSVGTN